MTRATASLALILLSGIALPAQAQTQSHDVGRVTGVVRNGQLRPMPEVEVTLATRSGTQRTTTNERGEFLFDHVPRGRALVVATQEGLSAIRRTELRIRGGDVHELEITLYPITGAARVSFDPEISRAMDFATPRGVSLGFLGNLSNSTLAIGGAQAPGSARAFRLELGHEFDTRWMMGVRGGFTAGETKDDLDFPYSARNTITYRDYSTGRLDLVVRASPLRNDRRLRPYGSASFGLSRFSGTVRVTTLEQPVRTTGKGIVITFGGGLQYSMGRNLALDVGAEWSGTSFEEWRIDNNVIGLPNLKVIGTDYILGIRWWPRAF